LNVFGSVNLTVLVPVDGESEEIGLLQANYKINKERMIGWELYGIDPNGNRLKITVCDCNEVNLNELID
jgi:hypothetical protein